MSDNFGTKLLRVGAFVALLAASSVAALTPDWATTLKAQDYSGYVDLLLNVLPGTPVLSAGTNAELLVTVSNSGPADADHAYTVTSIQGAATATATSGCLDDPLAFPECEFSTPLLAGASTEYMLSLSVSPLARSFLDITVATSADEPESMPDQALAHLHLPVQAHVDLGAVTTCERSHISPNAPLNCQLALRNAGTAAALMPYFYLGATAAQSNLGCVAPRPDVCPAKLPAEWTASVLMPGESAVVSFQLSVNSSAAYESVYVSADAFSGSYGETEDAPLDNSSSLTIPVSLFSDDFEGATPAPSQE